MSPKTPKRGANMVFTATPNNNVTLFKAMRFFSPKDPERPGQLSKLAHDNTLFDPSPGAESLVCALSSKV